MTTKINLANIDPSQDYSSLATAVFAKANVAANTANSAYEVASTFLKVTSIVYPGNDTAADTAGGQTITLTGSGFVSGASVLINGSAVGVVSVANSTTITFTSPSANSGSYVIYVINPDGATAISIPGIQYSGTPTWTTAAGSLGSLYETAAFSNTVVATGDTVSYSLNSGTLPPGATFSSNGTITGTSSTLSSPTTYTFTVRATDAQNQDTDRSFSITINPDVVTWSSPTTNTSYTLASNTAMSNVTLSASSAVGANIFYSANTLPTGVSLTGNTIFGTPTVTDETRTSLVTATANTTSESSSIILNWTISVANEAYFKYNSLLLSGDGTNNSNNKVFIDSSTNNFTITRTGNASQGTFSPYGSNWSNYFDGTGDYLSLTGSGLGSGNFTIELWGYFTSFPGAQNGVYTHGAADGINSCVLYITSAGAVSLYNYTSAVGNSTSNVPLNTWTHIAVTRVGSTLTYYINGVASGTGTTSANISETAVKVMQGFGGITNSPIGYISNLRTVVGTAVYTANFTPSTTPLTAISGTSLLTCADNRFIDDSTNNRSITKNGDVSVQRFSPFNPSAAYSSSTIGGSAYLDGTGDYLGVAASSALNLTSGDFTIECWFYLTQGGRASELLNKDGQFSVSYPQYEITINSSNALVVYLGNGGGVTPSGADYGGGQNVTINCWHHVAVQRTGSTISVYYDGTRITNTAQSVTMYEGNKPLYVGYQNGFPNDVFPGYVSNLRIVKGTAVYSGATITPPTSPVTAISGTSLLLNFTNAGIIDSTMLNNVETVGDAKISSTQSKFGGTSMYFDGTGDYLYSPPNINYAMGSGDFTIELWYYPVTQNPTWNPNIMGNYNAIWTTNKWAWHAPHTTAANKYSFWVNNIATQPLLASTSNVTNNAWVHLAVTRSGSTWRMFINGTVEATATSSAALDGGTAASMDGLFVGANFYSGENGRYINAYIDDLRITRGYARYTSNFTAPTTALPKL